MRGGEGAELSRIRALVASHGPGVGVLQASPHQWHGSIFRHLPEAPRLTAVTGAEVALNDRLSRLAYSRATSFRAFFAVRPLVGMVVKASAMFFATSKKVRSHFSGAI